MSDGFMRTEILTADERTSQPVDAAIVIPIDTAPDPTDIDDATEDLPDDGQDDRLPDDGFVLADAPAESDSSPTTPTAAVALAVLVEPSMVSSEREPLLTEREPLLTEEAEQEFLNRWTEVQIGFVEDPDAAVRAADALVDEIATTILQKLQARRTELAAGWRNGSPDTEDLRLTLKSYRTFIGLILPK